MPPCKPTMQLCDLLAQVRSYWFGVERRVEEECEQRGLKLALADRNLDTKHKRALRMMQRGKINSHDLFVRHSDTHNELSVYEFEARKTYNEEQFKRSGKSIKDFFFTPNVWDFCCQELIKVLPERLTENELDDYLANVTLRVIESSCRASVELARLHQQGFTTKLLARILTEYPNDAKAMKLSRPNTRGPTRTVEADLTVLTKDESSEPNQTHAPSPGSSEATDAETKGVRDPLSASTIDTDPGKAEWSEPMSRTKMAKRLLRKSNARLSQVKDMLDRYGIEQIGSEESRLYRIRIDTMDAQTRKNLSTPL